MKTRFVIFEDEVVPLKAHWQALLKNGVLDSDIYPRPGGDANQGLVSGTEQISNRLDELASAGWDPAKDQIVILLDVILQPAHAIDQNNTAMEKIKSLLVILEHYVVIIVSDVAPAAEKKLDGYCCDGFIDKGILRDRKPSLYWQQIQRSLANWAKRTNRLPGTSTLEGIHLSDSLAVRQLVSTFGDAFFQNFAKATKPGVTAGSYQLEVMTGGYSGAAVIKQTTASTAGTSIEIFKVAKVKRQLEEELGKLQVALTVNHKFGNHVTATLSSIEPSIIAGEFFFLRYPYSSGSILEKLLKERASSKTQPDAVPGFLAAIKKYSLDGLNDMAKAPNIPALLELSEEDKFRLRGTCELGKRLLPRMLGKLGAASPRLKRLRDRLHGAMPLLIEWEAAIQAISENHTIGYQQHGDMNPRNVIISDGGNISLIDFARFGVWPAMYDISRLELQAMRRLLNESDGGELFVESILEWDRVWDGADVTDLDQETQCASMFLAEMRQVKKEIGHEFKDKRKALELMAGASRIYDLFKMSSYQDISTFKRIWFLAIASDELQLLGKSLRKADSLSKSGGA